MNSCMSTELSACAPPLMMFIMGTGRMQRVHAAEIAIERRLLRCRPRPAPLPWKRPEWRSRRGWLYSPCHPAADHRMVDQRLVRIASRPASAGAMVRQYSRRLFACLCRDSAIYVVVAEFHGFVFAGGCAGGNGGAADGAIREINFGLHGGIAA